MPYCFSRSSGKFQGHTGQKNRRFWPELSFSKLQFEFIDGFEMPHKAWRSIEEVLEEVPYCFLRSSIKLQGHTGWKIDDLNPRLLASRSYQIPQICLVVTCVCDLLRAIIGPQTTLQ